MFVVCLLLSHFAWVVLDHPCMIQLCTPLFCFHGQCTCEYPMKSCDYHPLLKNNWHLTGECSTDKNPPFLMEVVEHRCLNTSNSERPSDVIGKLRYNFSEVCWILSLYNRNHQFIDRKSCINGKIKICVLNKLMCN